MRRVWGPSPTRSLEEDDPDWDRVRVSSMVSQVYRGPVWRQVVAARPCPVPHMFLIRMLPTQWLAPWLVQKWAVI